MDLAEMWKKVLYPPVDNLGIQSHVLNPQIESWQSVKGKIKKNNTVQVTVWIRPGTLTG